MKPSQPDKAKSLGLFDATLLVVGSMIGSGIFIVSADIARHVGTGPGLLAVWLMTGLITLVAALSYGELASVFPRAGGQYVYLREAFGPLSGFLYGWSLFLVIQTGTIAAVAVAFAKYLGVFLPMLSENTVVATIGPLRVSAAQMVAIASVWLLTLVNVRGIREGKIIQNVFTVTKIAALAFLIFCGLFFAPTSYLASNLSGGFFSNASISPSAGVSLVVVGIFCVAMVGSVFSSDAWNNITFAAGEVRSSQSTVPKSMALGTLVVTGIYIVANIAYLNALPLVGSDSGSRVVDRGIQYALNDRVGAAVAEQIFGPAGAAIMAALIVVSTFGCNNGLILAGARVYFAMATDKLFFKSTAKLNKEGVPAVALVIQAIWTSVLCLSGKYSDLLNYVVVVVLLFYILTVLGIFRLRKTQPTLVRVYTAPLYPYLQWLYIGLAGTIVIALLVLQYSTAIPGIVIVLGGLPVYFFWKRKGN